MVSWKSLFLPIFIFNILLKIKYTDKLPLFTASSKNPQKFGKNPQKFGILPQILKFGYFLVQKTKKNSKKLFRIFTYRTAFSETSYRRPMWTQSPHYE